MDLKDVYDKCVLLLPMNGENDGVLFPDYSQDKHTVTCYGNAKTSTAQSVYYGSSGYFDGTGDYLTISDPLSMQFGTGDFTVGCFAYIVSAPNGNQVIVSFNWYPNTTGFYITYIGGEANQLRVNAGSSNVITCSSGWGFSAWKYIELCRVSGVLYLFIDGNLVGSAAWTNNCSDGFAYFGRPSDVASYMLHGYVTDFFALKGVGLHTSSFTPPGCLTGFISNSGSGVGAILDAAGDPAERIIQAVPRGAARAFLATSDVDGLYSLQAPMVEHNVLLLDDSNLYQDILIGKRVMPI